jgi:sigma-E factor negative regulatory protein RseA
MSEQIREQVSAFLDGELPDSETELLLKRLTRDSELRHSFGRYALIGETVRGASCVSRSFAARVNQAIDGEPAAAPLQIIKARQSRWWRPVAGSMVAASVAAVAVVALQQRAVAPGVRVAATLAQSPAVMRPAVMNESDSYTVPPAGSEAAPAAAVPAARLTSYVFAHSRYSVGLGQGSMLSTLLSDADDPASAQRPRPAVVRPAVGTTEIPAQAAPQRDTHTAP